MIVVSPLPSWPLPIGDIPSLVLGAAQESKDKVVLVDAVSERKYTMGEISSTATQLAAGLVRQGFGGKTISVFDDTELCCVYVYFAALMAGGAYQSLGTDTNDREKLRERIVHSQTPIVFTTASYLPRLRSAVDGLDVAIYVLDDRSESNPRSFVHLLLDDPTFTPVRITTRDDAMASPAYLTYTLESLQPVSLSHFGLLSSYRSERVSSVDSPCKTTVSAVPFASTHGIVNIAHFPMLSGCCVVQLSKCDPVSCLASLEKWGAGDFLATYPVLASIVAAAKPAAAGQDGGIIVAGRTYDVSKLNVIFIHELRGAHAFKDSVSRLFNARLVEIYGYMETGLIAGIITEYPRLDGSVGLLSPNIRARIVLDGTELEDGQFGEILVNTPRLASSTEYFNTGDFGTVTVDGVVIVKARMTELLRLHDGRIVAPGDIEEQVLQLPGIVDCAVVAAVSDQDGGYAVPFIFAVSADSQPNSSDLVAPLTKQYPGIDVRRKQYKSTPAPPFSSY
ncbi:hypothetical protein GGF46_001188 [Coemansia sp. RSA 552]|nr:hypothetical protein GGF46_001188 [Coemansia sp. RSA 552]